jgi:hypothetical protein
MESEGRDELVIALVGAVGSDLPWVEERLSRLRLPARAATICVPLCRRCRKWPDPVTGWPPPNRASDGLGVPLCILSDGRMMACQCPADDRASRCANVSSVRTARRHDPIAICAAGSVSRASGRSTGTSGGRSRSMNGSLRAAPSAARPRRLDYGGFQGRATRRRANGLAGRPAAPDWSGTPDTR